MKAKLGLLILTISLVGFAQTAPTWDDTTLPVVGAHDPDGILSELVAIDGAFGLSGHVWAGHHAGGPCAKVKLDAEQKAKLKEAFFTHWKEVIRLKAELKISGLDYARALVGTDRKNADAAAGNVNGAVSKLVTSHLAFVTDGFQSILREEQRRPALFCLMMLKKHFKHHKLERLCRKYHHHKNK